MELPTETVWTTKFKPNLRDIKCIIDDDVIINDDDKECTFCFNHSICSIKVNKEKIPMGYKLCGECLDFRTKEPECFRESKGELFGFPFHWIWQYR